MNETKRFTLIPYNNTNLCGTVELTDILGEIEGIVENNLCVSAMVDLLNELNNEKEKLERINKGQEKEIVRLHKLADAMSGVLRELGIYDVYNEEQIQSIKEKLE